MAKVKRLKEIETELKTLLDPLIAEHLLVCNYREGCLVVQFENGSWATRFRYRIPELLEKLRTRKILPGVATIKCLVRPK